MGHVWLKVVLGAVYNIQHACDDLALAVQLEYNANKESILKVEDDTCPTKSIAVGCGHCMLMSALIHYVTS